MKNSTIIQQTLDNQSFLDWASSAYDLSHPFCSTIEYKQLDSKTLLTVKLIHSTSTFNTENIDLTSRTYILKNIHNSIAELDKPVRAVESTEKQQRPSYAMWMGIAASFVVLFMFILSSPFDNKVDLSTDYAEVLTQTLPDGSIVSLDANSALQSLGNWSGVDDRILKLTNDAYFSVTSDPQVGGSVFKVLTESADIEVLGTEFYVESNGATSLRVVVKEGKVKVSPNSTSSFASQILEAGDELIVTNGTEIKVSNLTLRDISNKLSWTKGFIVFDGMSFTEFKDVVKDRFGRDVTIHPALESSTRTISGSYPINSVEKLMQSIATTFDLQIDLKSDIISIDYIKKN